MNTLWQDFVFGCRMLWKKPGFTAAAVLSLAIGIGANTTIFSLINVSLLRGMPYPNADRLDVLWTSQVDRPDRRDGVTGRNYREWKKRTQSYAAVGAQWNLAGNLGASQDGSPAEQIEGQHFTYSMWDVLDVKPIRGRVFTEQEDVDGNPAHVILLSYRFWRNKFGGEDVVGKTVVLDNVETTILGVMPEDFDFASNETDFFAPAGFSPQQLNSAASFLLVVGRRKPDVSVTQAQSELQALARGLAEEMPDRNKGVTIRLQGLHDVLFDDIKQPLFVLQGAVAFVLLIACANIAGLLLARAGSRSTEMAVRSSLGAGRGRIVRQLLTESVLLSVAGGILGLAIAWVGVRALVAAMPPDVDYLKDAALDARVLGLTGVLSIATGLLFGLVPALQVSKVDLSAALKESGRAGMDGSGRQRLRSALVSTQIALALTLLIGAGLMMNSFLKLQNNKLGADPTNVLTFELRFPQNEMMKPVGTFRGVGLWEISPNTHLTFDRVHERIQGVPGVLSAAAISRAPLSGNAMGMGFTIVGKPAPEPGQRGMNAAYFAITHNYFATMKIPVLRGRDFTSSDGPSAPLVVVVNKTMADRWWPGEEPIGQLIRLDFVPDEQPRQVVGVVADNVISRFQRQPNPIMFVPHGQQTSKWQGPAWDLRAMMVFVMRTGGDPMSIVNSVRSAVAEVDRGKPAANMRTVEQYLGDQTQGLRIYMLLLAVFGVAAAVLAAIGIYGVMAYAVAQRTREIGIRMALGATGTSVMGLVVRQALLLIAIGLVLGLAGAYGLTRFIANELFNVSPTDPVTFTAVTAGLVVVAVLACLIPTRRAVRVDPTVALRYE